MKIIKILLAIIVLCAVIIVAVTLWPKEHIEPSNPLWITSAIPDSYSVYEHPESLGKDFISEAQWPPITSVEINPNEFVCHDGEEQALINGRNYCTTIISEGAAGSVYTTYIYRTLLDSGYGAAMTFALRYPNCENYDDPNRASCQAERDSFNVHTFADDMMQTIREE